MATTSRRHVITVTPRVRAALDELRRETGTDRIELGELVVLGAHAKLAALRAARVDNDANLRRRLADRVRFRAVPVDLRAAEAVRASRQG